MFIWVANETMTTKFLLTFLVFKKKGKIAASKSPLFLFFLIFSLPRQLFIGAGLPAFFYYSFSGAAVQSMEKIRFVP